MHAAEAIERAKRLNIRTTALGLGLAVSIMANLATGIVALESRQVILVPPLPSATAIRPGGTPPPEYLEGLSREITWTFLNRTPESDRYLERALERIVEPATYQKLKAGLVDDRKARQETRGSQAWWPDDFYVDPKKMYVEVRGNLAVSKGNEIVQTSRKIYALRFVQHGATLRLASITEITPEQSEGEKVKITTPEGSQ